MKNYEILDLDLEKRHLISFVGAGGKSTSMDILAKEFKDMGKKVLVTTTTVIFHQQHIDNDEFVLGELNYDLIPLKGSITLYGRSMDDGKIRGVSEDEVIEIYNRGIFDIILVEADGARMKPIKAPANHEPVVPNITTMTIGVIGLDAIGKPLDEEHVHRAEILGSVLNVDLPHYVDVNDIVKLASSEDGLFKRTSGRKVLFLNKADNIELLHLGEVIRRQLLEKGIRDVYVGERGKLC
ncbi:selenium cofactor biosynthesis protein YqeC [Tissierella sp.]|uniref:selenium cofactor biosynthesis protein YqeC n=1 Tax=Tissierella sp. TaxID=41274 RepID=UPI00285854F1|nr:selenium cofactor biosynthesis protein YqeC [Tissierella sp.]MDR7855635.1 selenium cofactor biosynthesis protein YqeC [Tissierella sp.]